MNGERIRIDSKGYSRTLVSRAVTRVVEPMVTEMEEELTRKVIDV